MNIKYILGAIVSIPLLPIIYFQGKKVRVSVPKLPEAQGAEGKDGTGKPFKMLAIGESTIAGVGAETHSQGFTGAMARELAEQLSLEVSWKVYARSGYTAKRVGEKIIPKIAEEAVDLIVIGLGGNDAFTLNTPAQWIKDVDLVLINLRVKFPDTPIVFANMPPIKLFPAFTPAIRFVLGNLVEIHGQALRKYIHHKPNTYYNQELVTLEVWMSRWQIKAKPSAFFSDGVHPSILTYQTWGKDLARFVVDKKILTSA
ncbi:MAG: lysophospholipase L1-like esterase [Cyclobacteriaceae bacterium]|jgi:lysophospholipase L1-like esterase